MMQRTNTAWIWVTGTVGLAWWLVLSFVFVTTPSISMYGHPGDGPSLFESEPEPVSTFPSGNDVTLEPSDPDAEPFLVVWTSSAMPRVETSILALKINRPGFPRVLEKPPRSRSLPFK